MTLGSIVVLISGTGTNLQAIIDATRDGRINSNIAAVISNQPVAKGLDCAKQAGINTIVIDSSATNDRDEYDAQLMTAIDQYEPALVVLAGFMRILSDTFIDHYRNKILNIHPALLPDFKGLHTHRRVLEAGKQVHGASVHFVSNELDSGPVVIQAEVPVLENDSESTLAARVLEQEHIIYPMAISWYVEGRLKLEDNKVKLDNKTLDIPAQWKSEQLHISDT